MALGRKLRMGMVGGGRGAFIGSVHRMAAIMDGQLDPDAGPGEPSPLEMYVYDADTGTVKRRKVLVGGVRENSILIIDGLEAGERVASAGVSFLRDGQQVNLLPDAE